MGKTKRGKGTKLMAVADAAGLPLAVYTTSASPRSEKTDEMLSYENNIELIDAAKDKIDSEKQS